MAIEEQMEFWRAAQVFSFPLLCDYVALTRVTNSHLFPTL